MTYSTDRARSVQRPRHSQLSDEVAGYIRELIMSGEVKGGEFLRVDRIASDMEVSVTPVREALAALRGEGFVEQMPRRGFVVTPLRARDVTDLFEEQARISGILAERAVAANRSLGDDLERIQDSLERAAKSGSADEVERLNFDFHRLINTASESHKLLWVLRTIVRYSPRRYFPQIPGWDSASVDEHRAIIAAFRAGSSKKARVAMEEHVLHAGRLLVAHLAERNVFEDA
jgi:DNA-binding GntR family transcriptional regulator